MTRKGANHLIPWSHNSSVNATHDTRDVHLSIHTRVHNALCLAIRSGCQHVCQRLLLHLATCVYMCIYIYIHIYIYICIIYIYIERERFTHICMYIAIKLQRMQEVPWFLFAAAHMSEEVALQTLRRALDSTHGHPLLVQIRTELRDQVMARLGGASLHEPQLQELATFLGSLRFMPGSDRPIEGMHARTQARTTSRYWEANGTTAPTGKSISVSVRVCVRAAW